jgi:hypothetical protein
MPEAAIATAGEAALAESFAVAAPEMFAASSTFVPAAGELATLGAMEGMGAAGLGGLSALGGLEGLGMAGLEGISAAAPSLGGAVTEGILTGGGGAGAAGINEALIAQQQANAVQVANSGMSPLTQGTFTPSSPVPLTEVMPSVSSGIEQVTQYPLGSSAERQALFGNTEGAYGLEGYDNRFMPLQQPTGLQAGFEKALNYVKENPFSAASMGFSAMKLLGGDKKQEEAPAEYDGILTKYKMSPNFQGRQANPQDFQYTPKVYAEGGVASFKSGGKSDPGGKLAMDYYESMLRQQTQNMPSTKGDVGVYYDLDPETRYLDPVSAAQIRMAKINKRSNVQAQNMKRPRGLGQINLSPPGTKAEEGGASVDAARGGIMQSSLGGYAAGGNPRLLKGPGDGMSDNIPATIAGKQPARLADGEFVIPADVVSHLGNGSTEAGAKVLHAMMTKVRKERTGNPKQGKQINPRKFVPT